MTIYKEMLQQLMLLADHLSAPTNDLTEYLRRIRIREARDVITRANQGGRDETLSG